MDPVEYSNYLSKYQKLLFGNKENVVDVNRKCLIQTYAASLKLLNNDATLVLLQQNLDKYTKALNRIEKGNCVTAESWQSNSGRRSCLKSLDVKSLLKPLPCSATDSLKCTNSTFITEDSFQNFMGSFQPAQTETKDVQVKKFTNSFPAHSVLKEKKSSIAPARDSTFKFKTASEVLQLQNQTQGNSTQTQSAPAVGLKRKLGYRRNINRKFVSPILSNPGSEELLPNEEVDEHLKNIDPKMVELIRSEIMENAATVQWDDIAGLESAKTAIQEAVVWPLLRPDIFTGLRKPPKGILLFGPPGTGKTLIGKCVASQSKSTFFSISASSLTSKWIGDGEKMVRALFAVALCHQPAVIFIDEIDSLLSQRSETEHESSRRLKTEFLIRLDGATTSNDERVLVIGATNRPQELDEAARRRFVKRLYIPLPEFQARLQIVQKLMSTERCILTEEDMRKIAESSDGYSGADMRNLCSEASLGPLRSIDISQMETIRTNDVRPLNMNDFLKALSVVKSSVSPNDLNQYLAWNRVYGSGCAV